MVVWKSVVKISPVRAAAVSLAFVLYAGILKPVDHFVFGSCLIPERLCSVAGTVSSNPVKTSSGRFYSVLLDVETVQSKRMSSSARGRLRVLIPAETVEAVYPGKLFSIVKEAVPTEQGARLICTGHSLGRIADVEKSAERTFRIGGATREQIVFIAEKTVFTGWKNRFCRWRAVSRLHLKRILYAWGDAGGLLLALMSGSREYTDETLAHAFQNAGLAHILALSGMHLSLFVSTAVFAGAVAGKKAASILSFLLMCVFIWFAGASPSLVRAFLCVFIIFAVRFYRIELSKGGSFDCLCAAFIVQSAVLHADIYNPAFMLSYTAIAGILLLSPVLCAKLSRFLPCKISEAVAVALGAWLCTAPLTLLLFGQITPVGPIASLIVTPLASLFFVLGCLCALFCTVLPFLLYPLNGIMRTLYAVLKCTVFWFARCKPIVFF